MSFPIFCLISSFALVLLYLSLLTFFVTLATKREENLIRELSTLSKFRDLSTCYKFFTFKVSNFYCWFYPFSFSIYLFYFSFSSSVFLSVGFWLMDSQSVCAYWSFSTAFVFNLFNLILNEYYCCCKSNEFATFWEITFRCSLLISNSALVDTSFNNLGFYVMPYIVSSYLSSNSII
jgi:hypothetical protein